MSSQKPKIVIFGSSWAHGEFQCTPESKLELSHPGISEYLADSYKIVNHSRPGSSLWQILYSVANYLEQSINNEPEQILIITTDIASDRISAKFDVDYKSIMTDCENFYYFNHTINEIFFIKLQELASRYDKMFFLVGSSTDIILDLSSFYNLKIICPSWIENLVDTYTPRLIPLVILPSVLELAKECKRWDVCEEIYSHTDLSFTTFQDVMESVYFENPKAFGDYHPNRHGHERLSQTIKQFFIDNEKTLGIR